MKSDVDRYFTQQVSLYQHELYVYARKLTDHPQDADDLFQEAITRAYMGINKYSIQQVQILHARSWLYKIMLNTFLNSRRGQETLLPLSQLNENPLLHVEDDWHEQPENRVESEESLQELSSLVEELPERFQIPIRLFYFQHLSYGEIAKKLDKPLNTVKSHIFQGKHLLRQAVLAQQEKEGR